MLMIGEQTAVTVFLDEEKVCDGCKEKASASTNHVSHKITQYFFQYSLAEIPRSPSASDIIQATVEYDY